MGLPFLITTDNLQLLSERKVLKESDYAALRDAKSVVEAAHREADNVARRAMREADASRRQGYQEGLERAKARHARELLSDAVAIERQLRALHSEMAQIVVKTVGQFVAGSERSALLESALLHVDTLIRSESAIHVRVDPALVQGMRAVLDGLHGDRREVANVRLVPDPSLAPGACIVQTAAGTLEIGVDAQLEAFRAAASD